LHNGMEGMDDVEGEVRAAGDGVDTIGEGTDDASAPDALERGDGQATADQEARADQEGRADEDLSRRDQDMSGADDDMAGADHDMFADDHPHALARLCPPLPASPFLPPSLSLACSHTAARPQAAKTMDWRWGGGGYNFSVQAWLGVQHARIRLPPHSYGIFLSRARNITHAHVHVGV